MLFITNLQKKSWEDSTYFLVDFINLPKLILNIIHWRELMVSKLFEISAQGRSHLKGKGGLGPSTLLAIE